ncbi:MAG: hypothetical protein HDT21_03605 [Ruminococcus sp.]|nr:hypothetical protein [Ruminococcus sp.]
MNITNVKSKVSAIADKVSNSKIYKAVERGAVVGSATLMGVGMSAVNAFAVDADNTLLNSITVDTADILNKAQPFITPAITVLCCVGGMKLGMRFLRSSMH